MTYNSGAKSWELTTADIIINAADNSTAFSGRLEAITNKITLRDNSESYILSVKKTGYNNYYSVFSSSELKLYLRSEDKGPLIVRLNPESISDIDGNNYRTIVIGSQIWMAENLRTTKFNDGSSIALVPDATLWAALSTPAYSWYNNDPSTYKNLYGGLYNWFSVNTGKLCPTGWHVATDAQWTVLTNYLLSFGFIYPYSLAKSLAATSNWAIDRDPTFGGAGYDQASNNSSGFTAYPGGERMSNGVFGSIGSQSLWWTATERSANTAWYRHLSFTSGGLGQGDFNKHEGASIRCLKD
jgi:uncharacterized protein (TIGR02145 family)